MVFDTLKAVRPSLRSNTMFPAPRLIVYDGKSRNPRVREVREVREGKRMGKHVGGVGE